ncbi:MAG TPA: GNAT family N-acetyltransferase [Gemmatimonadales bacterium]|nr:GNAT family N-acetyltransferase [Gemmatimonadales bacterium]
MSTIRPGRAADAPALLALLPELADFPLPAWRTASQVANADAGILLAAITRDDQTSCVLVAEDPDGSVAGFIFSTTRQDYFTGKPHTHIEVIVVRQDARGRGLSRRLIDATEAWARARGHSNVTLNVFATNQRAGAVYQRLGYEPETVHYIKPLNLAATRGELDP